MLLSYPAKYNMTKKKTYMSYQVRGERECNQLQRRIVVLRVNHEMEIARYCRLSDRTTEGIYNYLGHTLLVTDEYDMHMPSIRKIRVEIAGKDAAGTKSKLEKAVGVKLRYWNEK